MQEVLTKGREDDITQDFETQFCLWAKVRTDFIVQMPLDGVSVNVSQDLAW